MIAVIRRFIKRMQGPQLPPLDKGYVYRGRTVICDECCSNCGQCGNQWAFQRQQKAADDAVAEWKKECGHGNR
jgi:hypothetical protein